MTQTIFDPNDGELHVKLLKPHNLNVTLSGEDHLKLDRLAAAQGLNKSVAVRRLIAYGYSMVVQQIPVCASGGRCYVPQHHPPPEQSPHQTIMTSDPPSRPVAA